MVLTGMAKMSLIARNCRRSIMLWRPAVSFASKLSARLNIPIIKTHSQLLQFSSSFYTNERHYSSENGEKSSTGQQILGRSAKEARMAIVFTCKVCNERQTKTFSKIAYQKGVVIIECDGCKNRHLIADNLGWFNHVDARNIEDIMKQKGELVKNYSSNGLLEVTPDDITKID